MFTIFGFKAASVYIVLVFLIEFNISFKFPSQDSHAQGTNAAQNETKIKSRDVSSDTYTPEVISLRNPDLFQEVPTIQNSIDGWRVYGLNNEDNSALDYKKNKNLYKADDVRWVSENWKNIQTTKNKNILMEVLGEKNRNNNLNNNKTADNPKGFQNDILDMLGKMIPQTCFYNGAKFDCSLSISCVLEGGKPLDLCSGGMIWSCCVSRDKMHMVHNTPTLNTVGALENATMQFIMQHQQEQQYHQQNQQDPPHSLSSDHYPIYSSNHLDARPIPTFFTQTQKPHFLLNLLQGFQQPWSLTTTKPTFVYMNSRPHASQPMSTTLPDVIVRPVMADSSVASSQTVSQTTGFRGKISIQLHFSSERPT
ncbi:hypothetical protein M8J76_001270 [Diaphorina citri]|nr:hypothetical protein M8J75_014070 [Diaphorina citri]KAI5726362.1 hypothetical protein M8J76_001270 [Diaphorina citri]